MSHSPAQPERQAPIIGVVTRGFEPMIEPGNTVTMHQLAQGVLDALAEAGYVIVPREPTEAMLAAGRYNHAERDDEIWQAMVEAAG